MTTTWRSFTEGGVTEATRPDESPAPRRSMIRSASEDDASEGLRVDHRASDDGVMYDVGMLKLKREIGETCALPREPTGEPMTGKTED